MTRQRALRLAREWAQGHMCSIRYGEVEEYHSMFAVMLEEAPPNEPLTLEQLREMDGEPVWVVPTGMHEKDEPMWCVLESPMALIPGVDSWSWDFDGYGETWIAYRRPSEGEA